MTNYGASERRNAVFSVSLNELLIIFLFMMLLISLPKIAALSQAQEDESTLRRELVQAKRELQEHRTALEEARDQLAGLEIYQQPGRRSEEFNRLVGTAQKAGEVKRLENRVTELESRLEEKSQQAERDRAALESRIAACEDAIGDDLRSCREREELLKARLASFRRQKGRGGLDLPPCWPLQQEGQDYGRPEYLLDIQILEDALQLDAGWPTHRASEAVALPAVETLVGSRLALAEFTSLAQSLLAWSDANACRHYVRVRDRARSKSAFKEGLLAVEGIFYKYLVREE